MRKPHPMANQGPAFESKEFKESPAYAEMCQALAHVGYTRYVDILTAPRETFLRFHRHWTDLMCARAGVPLLAEYNANTSACVKMTASARTKRLVLEAVPADEDAAIRQDAIASRLNIGRTTVRSALRDLEDEGVIQMREGRRVGQGRGQRVTYLYWRAA